VQALHPLDFAIIAQKTSHEWFSVVSNVNFNATEEQIRRERNTNNTDEEAPGERNKVCFKHT